MPSTVEIFALILAILVVIKLLVLVVNKNAWLNIVKPLYAGSKAVSWISGILGLVVLYYILQSGMNIVQIFAAMLFFVLMMLMVVSAYGNDLMSVAKKVMKRGFPAIVWVASIIWLVLSIWVIYTVFA